VYFGGDGEHACGDIVVDLDGGLGHNVLKGLDILVKVLQLLMDHCVKDVLDLALLGEVAKEEGEEGEERGRRREGRGGRRREGGGEGGREGGGRERVETGEGGGEGRREGERR